MIICYYIVGDNMNIEYRKVDKKDLNSLKELLKNNFNVEIRNISNENNQYSLVAIIDNKVVGHLLFTKIYNPITEIYFGKIDYVCVDENYRNNKIATNLLIKIEEMEKDVNYFELTSNKSRVAANELYKKQEYEVVDTNLFRKFINI